MTKAMADVTVGAEIRAKLLTFEILKIIVEIFAGRTEVLRVLEQIVSEDALLMIHQQLFQ